MERRSVRSRKVSRHIGIVSATERENVKNARLEALENDDAAGEGVVGDSDEEFLLEESDEEMEFEDRRKRSKKGKSAKRKTRAMLEAERKGPLTFASLLEEAASSEDALANEVARMYSAAAAGPPEGAAPRKWCSVCGFAAPYKCVRCGSRFCTRKCYAVHMETRCLKFVG